MESLTNLRDPRPVYTVQGRDALDENSAIQLTIGVTDSYLPIPETLDGVIQDLAAAFKTWGGYGTVTVSRFNSATTDITPTPA